MAVSWDNLSDQELELIDGWCDRFEVRWKRGESPVIESIIRGVPPQIRQHLCRELVFLEFDLRQSRGEKSTSAEYCRRFPELTDQIVRREKELMALAASRTRQSPENTDHKAVDRTKVPRQIAQYQILEVVGESEVGPIVRAMDPKRRRVVSVTVLRSELVAHPPARLAFLAAARSVAAITDPHVAAVFETFDNDSIVCQFQEYLVGQSLRNHLEQGMAPSYTEIGRIGWQAASGLAAAHQQGVVHGGLTASSLILENGLPRIKIVGFGQRQVMDVTNGLLDSVTTKDSPLRFHETRPSPSSDLFDLGCILYMLCERKPLASSAPHSLSDPKIPSWLAAAVHRLLAPSSQDGFPSAAALVQHLGQGLATPHMLEDSSAHARVDLPAVPPRNPGRFRGWLAIGIGLLILAIGCWVWKQSF